MKRYMFAGAVLIETEHDFEIWYWVPEHNKNRELIYKRSDPSTHDNSDAIRLLEKWKNFEPKSQLELCDDFESKKK